jgi:Domain of unknown function (DUF4183)
MRTILFSLVALRLFAQPAAPSQQQINVGQIKCPVSNNLTLILGEPSTVTVTTNGVTSTTQLTKFTCIGLDPAFFKVGKDSNGNPLLTFIVPTPPPGSTVNWTWAETPTGAIDGTNTVYQTVYIPTPAQSLQVWINGILQPPANYTVAGQTITFNQGSQPVPGDSLAVCYTH